LRRVAEELSREEDEIDPSEHCSREVELLASQLFLCRSRFTTIASFSSYTTGAGLRFHFPFTGDSDANTGRSTKEQSSEVKNSVEIPEHTA